MFLTINDIKIHVKVMGSGPALFLLHGNQEDMHVFDNIKDALSKKYTLYMMDSRNHGQSEMTDIFDYDQMADDFIKVVEHFKIKPDVLGFSDGGIVALKAAILDQNMFGHLHLLGINISADGLDETIVRSCKADNPYDQMMLNMMPINHRNIKNVSNPISLYYGEFDCVIKPHIKLILDLLKQADLFIIKKHDHVSYLIGQSLLQYL